MVGNNGTSKATAPMITNNVPVSIQNARLVKFAGRDSTISALGVMTAYQYLTIIEMVMHDSSLNDSGHCRIGMDIQLCQMVAGRRMEWAMNLNVERYHGH